MASGTVSALRGDVWVHQFVTLGEVTMDRDLPSLRITAVRFFVLFAAAFLTWCMALLITRDAVAHAGLALGLGLALADVLACLGVLAARWLDEAYTARCR